MATQIVKWELGARKSMNEASEKREPGTKELNKASEKRKQGTN
jgi:hypothetical protein